MRTIVLLTLSFLALVSAAQSATVWTPEDDSASPEVVLTSVVGPDAFVPTGAMPAVNMALAPAPAAGYSELRLQKAHEGAEAISDSPDEHGVFRLWCEFSHMLNDDPIVFPGGQNKSYLHTFFGNTGANYLSTSDSIKNSGNSTCLGGIADRSAYWMPAMIDTATGAPLKPDHLLVYYREGPASVIPNGLKMMAGVGVLRATSVFDSRKRNSWFECNEVYDGHKDNIHTCDNGGRLTMAVAFPECWNGKDLDSPDHKSHMAYAKKKECPAAYPIKLPQITMIAHYLVTTDAGTTNWRLSSDMYPKYGQNGGYSAHAGFMYGWDDAIHKTYVDNCINKSLDCHANLLGDGNWLY